MAVQDVARIFLHDHIHCVKQALKVALVHERRTNVRHDEVASEKHSQFGQMDEHRVMRFSAMNRNQLNARSADFQLGAAIHGCVRFEIANVIEVESLAKKPLSDRFGGVECALDFLAIVASGVKPWFRSKAAKVAMSADVIPVRVGDEDRG